MPRTITTAQLLPIITEEVALQLDPQGVHVIESAASDGNGGKLCKAIFKLLNYDDAQGAWLMISEELYETLPMIDPNIGIDQSFEVQP